MKKRALSVIWIYILSVIFPVLALSEPINHYTLVRSKEKSKVVNILQNIEFDLNIKAAAAKILKDSKQDKIEIIFKDKTVNKPSKKVKDLVKKSIYWKDTFLELDCAENKAYLIGMAFSDILGNNAIAKKFSTPISVEFTNELSLFCSQRFRVEAKELVVGSSKIDDIKPSEKEGVYLAKISFSINPKVYTYFANEMKKNESQFIDKLTDNGKARLKDLNNDILSLKKLVKRVSFNYSIDCTNGSARQLSVNLDDKDSKSITSENANIGGPFKYASEDLGSMGAWHAYKEICKTPESLEKAENAFKARW